MTADFRENVRIHYEVASLDVNNRIVGLNADVEINNETFRVGSLFKFFVSDIYGNELWDCNCILFDIKVCSNNDNDHLSDGTFRPCSRTFEEIQSIMYSKISEKAKSILRLAKGI